MFIAKLIIMHTKIRVWWILPQIKKINIWIKKGLINFIYKSKNINIVLNEKKKATKFKNMYGEQLPSNREGDK